MKKTIFLLFLVVPLSFSTNTKINESAMLPLVYNNSIYSKIKIDEIICSRGLMYSNTTKYYEWCYAHIIFLPEKMFRACTYTERYCDNFSVNETMVYIHPTLWTYLINDSEKCYYNESIDCDVCKNDHIYLSKLKFVGGYFILMDAEREKYSVDPVEIVIYLLILGIAYYFYKLRKR